MHYLERFPGVVSLGQLKTTKGLERMMVTQKGSRLSVQPVTKAEWEIVSRLTEEFWSGNLATQNPRTIFAVGMMLFISTFTLNLISNMLRERFREEYA